METLGRDQDATVVHVSTECFRPIPVIPRFVALVPNIASFISLIHSNIAEADLTKLYCFLETSRQKPHVAIVHSSARLKNPQLAAATSAPYTDLQFSSLTSIPLKRSILQAFLRHSHH